MWKIVLVSILWGCTNPFMREGSKSDKTDGPSNKDDKNYFMKLINFVKNWKLSSFFLELLIINESLDLKQIYCPKAVYVDNPYNCNYPPHAHESNGGSSASSPTGADNNASNAPSQPPTPLTNPYNPIPPNPYTNPYYAPYPHPHSIAHPTPPQHPITQQIGPGPGPVDLPPQAQSHSVSNASSSAASSSSSSLSSLTSNHSHNGEMGADGGYHHVTYPHYLSKQQPKHVHKNDAHQHQMPMPHQQGHNNHNNHNSPKSNKSKNKINVNVNGAGLIKSDRTSVTSTGAICPDPTTYLPFAHAGQSTPQMRTLHKIVWVLQHQTKPLTVDSIRSCLPGKKKAQINEIDYLLSSYESYNYTQSTMLNGRKVWELLPSAFPPEFWNMQWQRQ